MPKQLEILLNPNPELRKLSKNVEPEKISQADFQELLADMKETMLKKDGAGLAAPQIGKGIRVVVIHHDDRIYFFINPKINVNPAAIRNSSMLKDSPLSVWRIQKVMSYRYFLGIQY